MSRITLGYGEPKVFQSIFIELCGLMGFETSFLVWCGDSSCLWQFQFYEGVVEKTLIFGQYCKIVVTFTPHQDINR